MIGDQGHLCGKRYCLIVIGIVALSTTCPAEDMSPGTARAAGGNELVRLAGVQAGFCVHLGCGEGRLTAELSQGGKFLVQGLDPDQTTVDKARAYLASKDVYARVSVERHTLKYLPCESSAVRRPSPQPKCTQNPA